MLNICKAVPLKCRFKISIIYERQYLRKMSKCADNKFDTFRLICDEIGNERSYINKAKILQNFFKKGTSGKGFIGDTLLWVQFLIPGATQRVYNLQNKQMLKLFARIFQQDQQAMQLDLEQEGDVSETLSKYFESSKKLRPQSESTLYLHEVERFLSKLEQRTKEDEQTDLLRTLCQQATALDLRMFIRLVKQDLRINAGARHILDGLGPNAYPTYQSSRDLAAVVKQFSGGSVSDGKALVAPKAAKQTKAKAGNIQVMTPISPMLANACKSVEEAFKKSPGGLFSEIKYDGERVQIHKQGQHFKFFSRNLKPVMDHKIKRFKEFIPKAFPGGGDMILDSEIILTDTDTGELLPFGTLGAHKKKEYAHAEVCLFVFDCILYDGDDLTNFTFRERRKILEDNIKPIKSYVQLSESHFLKTKNELSHMTAKVLKANLEGVVLKSPTGTYQPGKRGWLKVKKDYLFDGKMADTADLVVLGAWFGSGKKGGILSIFLMGCYDPEDHLWKTVTKVHSGLDDATNEEIHEVLMALMERADANKLPLWLLCKKSLVPDYIAKLPDKMPVWEITGAEFTKSEAHTAAGISIRFPRITKIRSDKTAKEANDLKYLRKLYDASKNDVNVDLLLVNCEDDEMKAKQLEIDSKLNLQKTPKKNGTLKAESPKTSSSRKKKLKREYVADEEEEQARPSKSPKVGEPKTTSKKKKALFDYFNPVKQTLLPANDIKTESTAIKKENDLKNVIKMETTTIQKESNLFKEIIAYFADDVAKTDYMGLVLHNGGTLTRNSQKATHVFHANDKVLLDLVALRKAYKRSCRHLSVSWLQDSLNTQICQPYAPYAVVLN